MYDAGKPGPTPPRLCAMGRHPTGLQPGAAQSRMSHLDQDDAQLHVGQIWPTPEQDASLGFTEPQAFHEFLDSNQNGIRYVSTLTEDRVEVHYTKQDHCESQSPNVNIFMACFTTCWAWLRLNEALELLGEQVLYFNMDSVVFAHCPGQASPALGQYLGEFKDELGEGDTIVEFCSVGPKNYGYKTQAGKTVCKVWGFSLNCQGAAQLNYDVLRQNVLDELHPPLAEPHTTRVTQSHTIQRQAKDYTLHTRPTHKDYRLVCSKCVVDPQTAQSYPYGYQRAV